MAKSSGYTCIMVSLLLLQTPTYSSALLYIVRQACAQGAVFTPVPATVNNICLQCKCIMANISYCKLLAVPLSIICSAAANGIAITGAVIPNNGLTIPIPLVPTIAPGTGIVPRASAAPPAVGVMMGGTTVMMMVTARPAVMNEMLMAAAATPIVPRGPAPNG